MMATILLQARPNVYSSHSQKSLFNCADQNGIGYLPNIFALQATLENTVVDLIAVTV